MEKKKVTISVALATYNEEENIRRCLDSVVSWADEVIIVDGGSTDRTCNIAREYKAKVIQTDNPPIFHINKQKALDACTGDWVLQLDADEVVTEELSKEILSVTQHPASLPRPASPAGRRQAGNIQGYAIPRKNFFMGHWMRKGGQYPDYVIRLFRREKGTFPSKSVHEQIAIDGKTALLQNPLLHNTYKSTEEYWLKANRYIDLATKELAAKRTPKNLSTYFTFMVFKPIATFFNIYFRHLGFVDGITGFLFALFSSLHFSKAYTRYIRRKE